MLEESFAQRPEEVVRHFRKAFKQPLTQEALRSLIVEARVAIDMPEPYARLLAKRRQASAVIPFAPPPPDKHGIPIDPTDTTFQPIEGALGWLFNLAPYVLARLFGFFEPAPLPRPNARGSNFCYRMRKPSGDEYAAGDSIRLALFSDWGTGRYYSKYITQEVLRWRPDYAFHLGDVYYAGRPSEFAAHVAGDIDQLSRTSRVFLLNGNHEMYDGHEYFRYLRNHQRRVAPFVPQDQEGSYFSLSSPNLSDHRDRYRV